MAKPTPKFGKNVTLTGGEFRGRQIRTPGEGTHPMGERERIALFNMIADFIPGAEVMDLYCGGGTLGLEAVSRGANFAYMIDSSEHAALTAAANAVELEVFQTKTYFLQEDAEKIAREPAMGLIENFDIVFADPPYDAYREEMVVGLPQLVKKGGILVLSHPGEAPELPGVSLLKSRKYARANISIYQK